jgi:hypothetical protein
MLLKGFENKVLPNGELTSAAELFREPPGFYEKPRFSRRLVKRLVIFLSSDACIINIAIARVWKKSDFFLSQAMDKMNLP